LAFGVRPKKVGDDALAFIRKVGVRIVVGRARPPDEIVVDEPKVWVHRRAISDDTVLQKVVIHKTLVVVHVGIVKKGNEFGIAAGHSGVTVSVFRWSCARNVVVQGTQR